jgi:hypothetical protein
MSEMSFWKISELKGFCEEPKMPRPRKEEGSDVLMIWRSSSLFTALLPLKWILLTIGRSERAGCSAEAIRSRQNRNRMIIAKRREALTPENRIFLKKKT